MKDRFEKELDEAVIDIDLENIQTNNSIFYIVSKRIIDIIGSLAGLIFLSPLFLIVAILIKLEDPKGKVFFSQERNGKYPSTTYIRTSSPRRSSTITRYFRLMRAAPIFTTSPHLPISISVPRRMIRLLRPAMS